jgi:filamentous hemagglutinin family protein
MKLPHHLLFVASDIVILVLTTCCPSWAQIVPDATLPTASVVTPQGATDVITGGTRTGSNLFHSFEQFSVPTNNTAYFNNSLDIQNIISRITGRSVSNIDGGLKANGTANLFLLNPNGIIFGDNATLSIGGSFLATTASRLNFADGTFFSAVDSSNTPPLLTVSVPVGVQFGSTPGRIIVQGQGQGLRINADLMDTSVGLRVQPDKTLALVGNDLVLEGGTLKTAGGRIELGSVAANSFVSLNPIDNGYALGYEGVSSFRDIQLSGSAAVDASGLGGGDIQVRGRQVTLTEGSQIEASTLGAEPGGTLNLTASESVELIGTSADGEFSSGLLTSIYEGATGAGGNLTLKTGRLIVKDGAAISADTFGQGAVGRLAISASDSVELIGTSADGGFSSGIFTSVVPGATGAGGKLTLETGRLIVRDGAAISANTFGQGAGGALVVTAKESAELIGTSADGQTASGLLILVRRGATGTGGKLTLETGRLIVRDGAVVSADTFGQGAGGTLAVSASDSVELIGTSADGQFPSGLFTSVRRGATGTGGKLTLETGRLILRDGAQIAAATFSQGAGGTLAVSASDSVELIGSSANGQFSSGLFTAVQPEARGAGGNLTLETRQLTLQDGAQVSAGTFGQGAGGRLVVRASDSVELIGTSADSDKGSALFTAVQPGATGAGGNLTLETRRLILRDGAFVSAGTLGKGPGGTLEVRASDSVELIGTSADGQFPSRLSARSTDTADAGDLNIATGSLRVRDGAAVTVSSEGSGDAGNLEVQANSIFLDNNGQLIAKTASGNGGNIILNVRDLLLQRHNSQIATDARGGTGNGGNIDINSQFIVAVPNENSDITANAERGRGGNINIKTSGIYGQEFRPSPTSRSDITASSEFGVNGTVQINTPDVDPSRGLTNLPQQLVDASGLVGAGCGVAVSEESNFVVTGRGGVPSSPNETLRSARVLVDLGSNEISTQRSATPIPQGTVSINPDRSFTAASANPTNQLVEARGWVKDAKGEVILTAQPPTVTADGAWLATPNCEGR